PAAGIDDFSAIQAFLHQQTSSNPVVRENASVVVLNATDISGLASQERTRLKVKDLNVVDIDDAQSNDANSSVIDLSGGKKPATRKLLGEIYKNRFTTANPYGNLYDVDFIVLVGSDRAAANSNN
ncbi:MAG TPA: LytR C-terminal domain-containing protein, partial [Candidatus Saccharimonadales bacterium]|nr:LytR C-terminal domain-containing protein [Candidatus Saccharimonadales bacterium]